MERTTRSLSTVDVKEVSTALRQKPNLLSDEEKAMRMRYGAPVEDLNAPLARAAGNNAELDDELLVMEMQILKAMRARGIQPGPRVRTATAAFVKTPAADASPLVEPKASRTKDKIIRALRKKK